MGDRPIVPVLCILLLQLNVAEPRDIQTVHLALLLKGPKWTAEATPDTERLQRAHLAYLTKLGAEGQALIAGPFGDDGEIRGIVMLKAASMDEAKALAGADPAVAGGRLTPEILAFAAPGNWFGFDPVKDGLPMRRYVFGFLNAGPNQEGAAEALARLQDAHLAHLWTLREAGALVMGGPIVTPGVRRGVVVLAVDSLDEARTLAEKDPAVAAGRFVVELHPWFAADGIMKKRVEKW